MAGEIDLRALQHVCDLTANTTNFWSDAAAVMLHKFHSVPPPPTALAVVHDDERSTMQLTWTPPMPQTQGDHANEKDATEHGAYAVAIAAAHHRGYRVRRRTHQGSGADLLMVRHGEPQNDFVKLEVSGIARDGSVATRLKEKIDEVRGGDLRRPGVAVVVRFKAATVTMESTP